jgi:hypothetical protein
VTAETIIANYTLSVIARSAATKQSTLSFCGEMDCFAALAMTGICGDASGLEQQP